MSDQSLQDILKAEQEAAERIRQAQEEADRLRKSGAEKAAEIDSESAGRIEAQRRQALERLHEETAQFQAQAMKGAQDTVAEWRKRYEERKEAVIAKLCRVISGEGEA